MIKQEGTDLNILGLLLDNVFQFLYVAEYQPRCTEDGEVGEGEDVNTEMVEKILSGAWHTVETPATNTVSLVPISPVTHYEIRREVDKYWLK